MTNKKLIFIGVILFTAVIPAYRLFAPVDITIKLATTTSVDNTGLLSAVLPKFEETFGLRVHVIAVGTGKAIKLAENGDVDAILVHDPELEAEFIKKGFGVNRKEIMYNDFVIVGPINDPAMVKEARDIESAFIRIYRSGVTFVSRGDGSGTDRFEKRIWSIVGINPNGKWHIEVGQGMGATLQIAHERNAYTLSDRATFLKYEDKIRLRILFEGKDRNLRNVYSIIAVDPTRHRHVKYAYAMTLINWLTSLEGQKLIANFKSSSGEQMFYPSSIPIVTER